MKAIKAIIQPHIVTRVVRALHEVIRIRTGETQEQAV